jgi:hypothetical protein
VQPPLDEPHLRPRLRHCMRRVHYVATCCPVLVSRYTDLIKPVFGTAAMTTALAFNPSNTHQFALGSADSLIRCRVRTRPCIGWPGWPDLLIPHHVQRDTPGRLRTHTPGRLHTHTHTHTHQALYTRTHQAEHQHDEHSCRWELRPHIPATNTPHAMQPRDALVVRAQGVRPSRARHSCDGPAAASCGSFRLRECGPVLARTKHTGRGRLLAACNHPRACRVLGLGCDVWEPRSAVRSIARAGRCCAHGTTCTTTPAHRALLGTLQACPAVPCMGRPDLAAAPAGQDRMERDTACPGPALRRHLPASSRLPPALTPFPYARSCCCAQWHLRAAGQTVCAAK